MGIAGPDGLKVDSEGNLFIAHASLGTICVVTPQGLPLAKIVPPEESGGISVTNMTFGVTQEDKKRLYFVESRMGRLNYVDWHCEGVLPLTKSAEA